MSANSALGILLLGLSLALQCAPPAPLRRTAGRLLAAAAGLIGLITIAEYLTGLDLGIDQLLATDVPDLYNPYPGRTSGSTAVNLTVLGLALVFLDSGSRWYPAEVLAPLAAFNALLALAGYLYGAEALYRIPFYSAQALHTATGHLLLALGILAVRPGRGLMAVVTGEAAGGTMARRLLPSALVLPHLIAWLLLKGDRPGYSDLVLRAALVGLSHSVLFSALILWNARLLERQDRERLRAKEALHESEARFAGIVELALDAIITIGSDQRIVLFNRAAEKMFRCSSREAIGTPVDRFIPVRFRGAHAEHVWAFGRGDETSRPMGQRGAIYALRANGEEFPIEASISRLESGGTRLFTVILRDITARQAADAAVRASDERLRLAAEATGFGTYEYDPLRRRSVWSAELYAIMGWPDAAGVEARSVSRLAHPEDREVYRAAVAQALDPAGPGRHELEFRIVRSDGETRWLHDTGRTFFKGEGENRRAIRIIGTVRDITARRHAEDALRQAQKMEAVGRLTGGVAHDFNNLLTVISGNLQMLEETVEADGFARERVAAARDAAGRGAELVRQLLALARRQILQPTPVDLNELFAGLMPLLPRTLGENVSVQISVGPELWPAIVDRAQLQTALLNLVLNARDAMPQGGQILIEASNVTLDEAYSAIEVEVVPGDYVIVAVSDAGIGMSEDIQRQVFDPFFTTKEAGKGSGLGLAMVYGFAKQSGGHVKIVSGPGLGTTVKLFLPRAVPQAPRPEAPGRAHPRGGEMILVVEDEPAVRAVAVAFLTQLGYRVREASDGPSALAVLDEGEAIDGLFVDLVLPGGMGGVEIAAAARRLKPAIKLLYTSGYPRDAVAREGRLDPAAYLLPKPYTRETLAQALRLCLDAELP
jgi:PAS domain S-box-containing protein